MWKVRLEGDEELLKALSERFSTPELSIEAEGDEFWLSSRYLEGLSSRLEVYESGEDLISFVNASSKLINRRQDPVKSNGYGEESESGTYEYQFHGMSGPTSIPIRSTTITNELPEEDLLELYVRSDRVKFVLSEFNRKSLDWFTLFNIHEAVFSDSDLKEGFGSPKEAIAQWSSKSINARFLGTANWHRHSKFGRTSARSSRPPKDPLRLVEAEEFVREIVLAWLKFKGELA